VPRSGLGTTPLIARPAGDARIGGPHAVPGDV